MNTTTMNRTPDLPADDTPLDGDDIRQALGGLQPAEVIQLTINFSCLIVGLPLNIMAFVQVTKRYLASKSRIFLLYLSLNLSDIMVLVFHSLVNNIWLVNFVWLGGDFLCRLWKTLESVSFAISAYVMVCIALDRLYCLKQPFKAESLKRVRKMLAVAWIAAVLVASPQYFTWLAAMVQSGGYNYVQCVNVWSYRQFLRFVHNRTGTADGLAEAKWDNDLSTTYAIYSLVVLFWIPIVVLCISYALILQAVERRSGETIAQRVRNTMRKKAQKLNNTPPLLAVKPSVGIVILWAFYLWAARPENSSLSMSHVTSCSQQRSDEQEGLRRVCGAASVQRAKARTLRITLMLVTFYMVCWLPYNCMQIWYLLHPSSYSRISQHLYFVNAFIVLNSVVNPLVYTQLSTICGKNYSTNRSANQGPTSCGNSAAHVAHTRTNQHGGSQRRSTGTASPEPMAIARTASGLNKLQTPASKDASMNSLTIKKSSVISIHSSEFVSRTTTTTGATARKKSDPPPKQPPQQQHRTFALKEIL